MDLLYPLSTISRIRGQAVPVRYRSRRYPYDGTLFNHSGRAVNGFKVRWICGNRICQTRKGSDRRVLLIIAILLLPIWLSYRQQPTKNKKRLKSRFSLSIFNLQNPEPRTQDREPRTQDREPGTQSPEPIFSTEFRFPAPAPICG